MSIWSSWGGRSSYAASQQNRYNDAIRSGDRGLQSRLEADSRRAGYSLNSPTTPSAPAAPSRSPSYSSPSPGSSSRSSYSNPFGNWGTVGGMFGSIIGGMTGMPFGSIIGGGIGTGLSGLNRLSEKPIPEVPPVVPQYPVPEIPEIRVPEIPTLSFDEARQRAESSLNPLYGDAMQRALQQVDDNNIRRGFFGQLPGAELSRSTVADIETKKASSIGQMANQLVGQSEESARAQQALALQQNQAQTQAYLEALRHAAQRQDAERANNMSWMNYFLRLKENDQNQEQSAWQKGITAAGLTGTYNGQPTWERQQWDQQWPWQQKIWQSQIGENNAQAARALRPPSSGVNAKTKANTNDFVAELYRFYDPKKARQFIEDNSATAAANGVDMSAVLKAYNAKWPGKLEEDYK